MNTFLIVMHMESWLRDGCVGVVSMRAFPRSMKFLGKAGYGDTPGVEELSRLRPSLCQVPYKGRKRLLLHSWTQPNKRKTCIPSLSANPLQSHFTPPKFHARKTSLNPLEEIHIRKLGHFAHIAPLHDLLVVEEDPRLAVFELLADEGDVVAVSSLLERGPTDSGKGGWETMGRERKKNRNSGKGGTKKTHPAWMLVPL